VGELLWAANRAQASFCDLFSVLVDPEHLEAGIAIWFSMQGDRAQLSALQSLLKARMQPESRVSRSAQWAIAAAEKLAEIRNDAAHMATSPTMGINGLTFIPNALANPSARLQRRSNTGFLNLFLQAKGDYVQVQQFVHDIFCHIAYPTQAYPLPLRPKLQTVVLGRKLKK
jgi:hypothetical protein